MRRTAATAEVKITNARSILDQVDVNQGHSHQWAFFFVGFFCRGRAGLGGLVLFMQTLNYQDLAYSPRSKVQGLKSKVESVDFEP